MVLIRTLLLLYIIAIVLMVIMSWFPIDRDGPAQQIFVALRRITDPIMVPVRRVVPPVGGALDLSPMIVLFVLLTVHGLL